MTEPLKYPDDFKDLKAALELYKNLNTGGKGSVSDKFTKSVLAIGTPDEMTKQKFYESIMFGKYGYDKRTSIGAGSYNKVDLLTSSKNPYKKAILRYPRGWSDDFNAEPSNVAEVYLTDNISRKRLTPKLYEAYAVTFNRLIFIMSISEVAEYPDVFSDYLLGKIMSIKSKSAIQSELNRFSRNLKENIQGIANMGYLPYDVKLQNYVVMKNQQPLMIDFDSGFMRINVTNPIHSTISCLFMIICSTQWLITQAESKSKDSEWVKGLEIIKTLQIYVYKRLLDSIKTGLKINSNNLDELIEQIYESDGVYLEMTRDVPQMYNHYCGNKLFETLSEELNVSKISQVEKDMLEIVYNSTDISQFLMIMVSVFYNIKGQSFVRVLKPEDKSIIQLQFELQQIFMGEILNYNFKLELSKFTYPISVVYTEDVVMTDVIR